MCVEYVRDVPKTKIFSKRPLRFKKPSACCRISLLCTAVLWYEYTSMLQVFTSCNFPDIPCRGRGRGINQNGVAAITATSRTTHKYDTSCVVSREANLHTIRYEITRENIPCVRSHVSVRPAHKKSEHVEAVDDTVVTRCIGGSVEGSRTKMPLLWKTLRSSELVMY